MDFFKSILLDDSDPLESETPQRSEPNPQNNQEDDDIAAHDSAQSSALHDKPISNSKPYSLSDDSSVGGWSFGGLINTLATRSESVLETYRRDLQEFGSGLKKETNLFREVASRAVKDLPVSIEVGASVAHGSLESVSHALDGVLKSTAGIISHGKEALLLSSDIESDTPDNQSSNSRRYSWFDAQMRAIQSDIDTYCEEPEDLDEYNKWKLGFVLEEKTEEIENLIRENGAVEEIYRQAVPNVVDHGTFWYRYLYRVHKLNQQEMVRAKLVKRAILIDDEEELSWDVDDGDGDQGNNGSAKGNALESKELGSRDMPQNVEENSNDKSGIGSSNFVHDNEDNKSNVVGVDTVNVVESSAENVVDETLQSESSSEVNKDEYEKVALDEKADQGVSCKDSDVSVVSIRYSMPEEEDLEWDEIEDLGSNDEKKITETESPNKADVRKRLSAAEEDEHLSWDIEDDDDPVKLDTK